MDLGRTLRCPEMENKWRLILNDPMDLYSNMALDEALYLRYCLGGMAPTLRFYSWQKAAFSLGYFQDAGKNINPLECVKNGIYFVRRITGGGIIFHDREVTYSMVFSRKHMPRTGSVTGSFKTICSFLINFYKNLGLDPAFAVDQGWDKDSNGMSELCFASREKYDIIVNGRKIGGNAQKRGADVVFQHGSIPLKVDVQGALSCLKTNVSENINGQICSLEEIRQEGITAENIIRLLRMSFENTFDTGLFQGELDKKEKVLFKRLLDKKYRTSEWNIFGKDLSGVDTEKYVRLRPKAAVA